MDLEIRTNNTGNRGKYEEAFISNNLYVKLVKRRKDGFCQECKKEIVVGENVLRVEEHDGFLAKYVGIMHIDCFKKLI